MLDKIKISIRLIGGFGVLLAVVLVIGAYSIWVQKGNMETLADVAIVMEQSATIQRALKDVAFARGHGWTYIATGNAAYLAKMDEFFQKGHQRLDDLEKTARSAERRATVAEVKRLLADFEGKLRQLTATHTSFSTDEGKVVLDAIVASFGALNDSGARLADAYRDHAAEEKATAEADARADIIAALVLTIAATLIGLAAAVALARSINRPLEGVTGAVERLSRGDTVAEVPGTGRVDEFGPLARALDQWRTSLMDAAHHAVVERQEAERQARRATTMEKLTQDFDRGVANAIATVAGAAAEMTSTAQAMSANAQRTTQQATMVASAAEQSSHSSQAVAGAAEELAASISEISRQVAQSSNTSKAAAEAARQTNETVKELAEDSAKIGEVVKMITDIASQTNLLALNATIEAARAGDAGKGFAVVANEVKNLANQTARATDEIGAQIGAVQGATRGVVEAIGGIVDRIEEINQIAGAIAAAVEEQGAATSEIARNVQQAAAGAEEVSGTIVDVTRAAGETGAAAGQVLSSATSLSQETKDLKAIVEKFLSAIKTA